MYTVYNMAVVCIFLLLCCTVILLRWFLNYLEMVSLPLLLLLSLLFYIPHKLSPYFQFLYFRILSAYLLIILVFLSPKIAVSINRSVPFSLSRIVISDLFLGMVLSVFSCRFYMLNWPSRHVSLNLGSCVHCLILPPVSCMWSAVLLCCGHILHSF